MNIRFTEKQEEFLNALDLSRKNKEIAQAYRCGDMADDSLLEDVEHQNFRNLQPPQINIVTIHLWESSKLGRKYMDRDLKLLWAIGKSSASLFYSKLYKYYEHEHLLEVLPKSAVAAMQVEQIVYQDQLKPDGSWLNQLAQTDPEALELVPELSDAPGGNLKVLTAGFLLCHATDADLIARHKENLIGIVAKSMDLVVPGFSQDAKQALLDYIDHGSVDDAVPVPVTLTAKDALSMRNSQDYMTLLLGTACYLAQNADERIRRALRVFLALNPRVILYDFAQMAPEWFVEANFDKLLADVPGGAATMLLHLSRQYSGVEEELAQRLIPRCREGVMEALQYADGEQHVRILQTFPEAKKQLGDLRGQLCSLVGGIIAHGTQELRDFLMGSGSMKDVRRDLSVVKPIAYRYTTNQVRGMIVLYRLDNGWDDFVCRWFAVMGLLFRGNTVEDLLSNMGREQAEEIASTPKNIGAPGVVCDPKLLTEIIPAMREREFPMEDLLNICEKLRDDYVYVYQPLCEPIQTKTIEAVTRPENIPELAGVLKTGGVYARLVAINALYNLAPDHPEAKKAVLSAIGDSSKQIKENLMTLFIGRPEWAEDYKKLLSAKKAADRLFAVQLLGKLGERASLETLLKTEKNAKVADAIRNILGAPTDAPAGAMVDLVTSILKGNKLKKLSWLLDQPLTKVRKVDGTDADETIRNAILVSYSELGRIGRSETAAQLAADLDAGDLARLACEVYEHWYAAGAQAKHKWVLAFAAVYGGPAMTQRLKTAISDWPNHQRGAIACEAVMALALSPDPAALVIVDSISRKFKFRQVKQAATAALENAAQELGITAEELADRIVPDLGFGRDGKRVFDYGKRSFTVRLTPTLELEIVNDQGKAVKNLPAPGKTDEPQAAEAYEEFKNMKKQIKTTVTAQRARLEAALSVLRCWDADRWNALFVENPIMHQFAMSLIWGVYEDGKLTDTFRYMEDGTFNTVDEDEYELPAGAKIGLVHPVELDEEILNSWKQQLEDYEIVQSLDQLGRPVYSVDPEKAGEKELVEFAGKELNGLSLSGKLLGQGWYRGSVQDGGMFSCYYREDKEPGIGVELRFSGSFVGYDEGEDVTVYEAVFYRGTVNRGSYVYDEVPQENIVPLGQVGRRYYSEIIHQLNKATASSTSNNADWRSGR